MSVWLGRSRVWELIFLLLCLIRAFVTPLSFITLPTAFLGTSKTCSWRIFYKLREGENFYLPLGTFSVFEDFILAPLALSCWDTFSSSPFSWTFSFLDLTCCCFSDPNCLYFSGSVEIWKDAGCSWCLNGTVKNSSYTVFLFILSMLLMGTQSVICYILCTLLRVPQSKCSCLFCLHS